MATGRSRVLVAASSQYLDNSSPPATAVPLTISAWVKPNTAAGTAVCLGNSGAAGAFLLYLGGSGDPHVYAYTIGASSPAAVSTTTYTSGRWQHICGVYASATSRAAYLNGASKGTDTTNLTPAGINTLNVGRQLTPAAANYFDGTLAGIAVWTVALTDAEVAMLASGVSPLRIQRASLVFYALNAEDVIVGSALTNHGPTISQADPADIAWTINSVDRTTLVNRYESDIDLNSDGTPDTCTVLVRGFTPTVGLSVQAVYHNDILFSGEITDVELIQSRSATRARYRCKCTDWMFLLNRRLVLQKWTATAVNTIVANILTNFTSGFTTTNVESALTAIDFDAIYDTVSSALQRLADAVGARWKVRPDKDLYFRVTSNLTAPGTLDANNLTFRRLAHHFNFDQIRNRIAVRGAGSQCVAPVPVGAAIIPIDSTGVFSTGTLVTGAQKPTYTGVTLANQVVGPPVGGWSVTQIAGVGALPINTTFSYKVTYTTQAGETLASSVSPSVSSGNDGAGHGHNLAVAFTPTAGTVPNNASGWRLWRSTIASAGAGPWKLIFDQSLTNVFDQVRIVGWLGLSDATPGDGATSEPSTSTAGPDVIVGSTTNGATAAGAAAVPVIECGRFTQGGGGALVTVNGHPIFLKYSSVSAFYGNGTLAVPATGYGSVAEAIASGTQISNVPCLTGVSGIVTAIKTGEAINLFVQRDDATSQTAVAALEGGDGIHEFFIDDSSLDSVSACNTRGDAELSLGKNTQESCDVLSEDQYCVPGAGLPINIAGISVTLPIAHVHLSWVPERRNPQREVQATSLYKTLYQFLADLQHRPQAIL